ncbi:MAG: DUF928 domain-containing protein [Synechococcales cyanobacterium RM1_1_8]|nr:DUF928 domain-containing protein [Synechococcales cyanobacterium RM1_1_8]
MVYPSSTASPCLCPWLHRLVPGLTPLLQRLFWVGVIGLQAGVAQAQVTPDLPWEDNPAQAAQAAPVFGRIDWQTALLATYFVPPKQDAPQSTTSSATRRGQRCGPGEGMIEAIAPPTGAGMSISDRPAISLQLPSTAAQQVALVFRDPAGDFYQQALLPILPAAQAKLEIQKNHSAESGDRSRDGFGGSARDGQNGDRPQLSKQPDTTWVSFQLPASAQPLLPNRRYQWSLVVICGDSVQPDDPTFTGWVEYQAPTSEMLQTLAPLSLLERARWYGRNGYWYDMARQLTGAPGSPQLTPLE